jgi:hypothetical protein
MKRRLNLFNVLPIFLLSFNLVTHSQGCLPEGIIFSTQEQINNFPSNYPTCLTIEGDVIISGADITNLDSLIQLTNLAGDLEIKNTQNLFALNGLNNIADIMGSLVVSGNDSLSSFVGFENLITIGTNLIIGEYTNPNPRLITLNGLENLSSIGGSLNIDNNDNLSDYDEFESLSYIGADVYIRYNGWLIDLSGLNGITSIQGSLTITENLPLHFLTGLENLVSIGNDLYISNPTANYTEFNNLETVNGFFYLGENQSLFDLQGFNSLSYCGELQINNNNLLQNLEGINNLEVVSGTITITNNQMLRDISALANLSSIGNSIIIMNNNWLTTLNGLQNITEINGSLYLESGNEADSTFSNLSGLENLTHIGGYFNIINQNQLEDLSHLTNLSYIGNSLQVYDADILTDLSGLENLSYIGGALALRFNDNLETLSGLNNLSILGGGLQLWNNPELVGITEISGIDQILGFLDIQSNGSLSECDISSICDYLASPNGTIVIHDNNTGCNSIEEVEEACFVNTEENVNTVNNIRIFPNPAKEKVTIICPENLQIDESCIFSQEGRKLVCMKDGVKTIDVSNLRPGLYIVKIISDKTSYINKLIIKE